jgi:hypothetical protein
MEHSFSPSSSILICACLIAWNLGVQRDWPGRVEVEVNYVSARGTRLLRLVDGNPARPALVANLIAAGVPPQQLQFENLWFLGATENTAFLHAEL